MVKIGKWSGNKHKMDTSLKTLGFGKVLTLLTKALSLLTNKSHLEESRRKINSDMMLRSGLFHLQNGKSSPLLTENYL